ncbi:MAG TPA: hypothetical protein VM165_09645 [Planctomycetaceae bacterium]|nr:hypothetical protein [Planctomycetaceae bacterium]
MAIRRNPDPGRQAVAWLATAFVFLIGAVATALTLLAASERAGWRDWTVWAVLFVGVLTMLWALSGSADKSAAALYSWIRVRHRTNPLTLYKPRLRRNRGDGRALGSNQPPTLESLRESADTAVQWVPHSQPERSKPERPKK